MPGLSQTTNPTDIIDLINMSDSEIMNTHYPVTIESQDDIYEVMSMKREGFVEVKPWLWEKKE